MFNRFKRTTTAFAFFSLAYCYASVAQAVTFDWATVGNPGNAYDPETAFGDVGYTYRISKHEVTNTQYTEFLNAVAASDPNLLYNPIMGFSGGGITRSGLHGSYTYAVNPDSSGNGPGGTDYTLGDKPVTWISYLDAIRFTNWLENGQPTGAQDASTTEDGVYRVQNINSSDTRAHGATFFLPSQDEWYKAAYHDASAGTAGDYFDYPTGTDAVPDNNLPSADTGNSANFSEATGNRLYPMTDVGDYTLSESPYGTFDQGGNVSEWTEPAFNMNYGYLRGGSWSSSEVALAASSLGSGPNIGTHNTGFRVASIPEPSTLLLGALATAGLLMRRRSLR